MAKFDYKKLRRILVTLPDFYYQLLLMNNDITLSSYLFRKVVTKVVHGNSCHMMRNQVFDSHMLRKFLLN